MAEYGLNGSFSTVVKRAARAEKLITLLLLFILLTTATAGVSVVLTGPDWASLWVSLLLGMLLGWLLAILHWPSWRSALLLVGLGVLFSLLTSGGLGVKILELPAELFRLASQIIRSTSINDIDFTSLSSATGQVFSATGVVVGRVFTWLKDLLAGRPAFDPVAVGIVWNVIVWLVAAWSGWVVEAGRNALLAVLPALMLNLSTLSYGHYYTASLYLILGITLVLIAVVQFDRRQQEWRQTRVAFPAHKNREVGNISLVISIALVVVSAFISSLSLRQIIDWTSEIRRPSSQPESGLAKSLGIVPATPPLPDAFSNLRTPGLPRELLIGAGPELSGEEVMSVEVADLTSLRQNGHRPPLYWRSYTYDVYTGHGWSTSATQQNQYQASQPYQPNHLPDHQLIQLVVRLLPTAGGTVYAAGEPVEINKASTAAWRSSNDLFGIQTGETGYTVQSLIPVASEDQLRQAGQAYPRWVLQRYLALPTEVPSRIKQLAIQLTATEPDPYDRARAIEQYLRQTYPYSLDVPRPPANQDLVDYFLFDLRQGYCDYYASAMVVLSRAAGIPARLAVGYASGTFEPKSKLFLVTQAEAHSWVEVYFPDIGWVPFEPTAGLPPLDRSAQPMLTVTPTQAAPPPPPSGRASTGNLARAVRYLALGIVLLAGFSLAILDEISLSRRAPQALAGEVYRRLKRYGVHLSTRLEGGETPYEFAVMLSQRITQITTQGRMTPLGANSVREIGSMIHNIVHLSYNPGMAEAGNDRRVLKQWRALRWHLRLVWLLKSWQKMTHSISERLATLGEPPAAQAGQEG